MTAVLTFLSHTARPGGAELSLSRYLRATRLPVRLVTMAQGAVWDDLPCPVTVAPDLVRVAAALREADGPVVANSMRAALYAALVLPPRRPLVYWVRDGLTDSAMGPNALRVTRHLTARRTTAYLANSTWTASTVVDALGVGPERVHVVHSMCGVTTQMLHGPSRRLSASPLRLLFLGRVAQWKAPDVAVRALPVLRDRGVEATLTIAGGSHFGEDRYSARVVDLVAREPAAVMLGHVEDVQPLLGSHDLLTHCSTVPEPFGQVLVQALAAGLPVVSTGIGGPREILQGQPVDTTYLPGSPADLAAAVVRACGSYAELSEWGMRRALRYVDDGLVDRLDAVFLGLDPVRGTLRSQDREC